MAYVSVGASTVIGRHVQIMPLASIDGECAIGDFTTICQSATIYGRVVVEEGVFVGVGARNVNASSRRGPTPVGVPLPNVTVCETAWSNGRACLTSTARAEKRSVVARRVVRSGDPRRRALVWVVRRVTGR